MNQYRSHSLLSVFGDAPQRLALAVAKLQAGEGVIVVDDEDRENEGDFIFAAQSITAQQMNLLIRKGTGIVCLVLTAEHADHLELPPMVQANSSKHQTPFTVSIEAARGVSTGVSAADRVTTILQAVADDCQPSDLARPGHVFPLRAHPQGLKARRGHTEATIELMRLAGLKPAGVLCEVMNEDGSMARLPQLVEVARRFDTPIISIQDIVSCASQV